VLEYGADVGIAHDGDADRCLAIDHLGRVVDGDQIMAILAVSMKERSLLRQDTLVATVMSNLGLRFAMEAHGISMLQTKVGDRYVLETLNAGGYSLGGEQSGHVIMTDFATTGDGVLTGLHLLAEMARSGKSLAELAEVMTVYPQVMVNVKGVAHHRLNGDETIAAAVGLAEGRLGADGRVVLRPSGTEPLVRVMVEASDRGLADEIAQTLADVVRKQLAL
jgi:phosphoglucosamine mutase